MEHDAAQDLKGGLGGTTTRMDRPYGPGSPTVIYDWIAAQVEGTGHRLFRFRDLCSPIERTGGNTQGSTKSTARWVLVKFRSCNRR